MSLLRTAAKVGVASSVHGRVQRRQQQRWAANDQWQRAPPAAAPPPPGPPAPAGHAPPPPPPHAAPAPVSTADKIAQLKTLGELRDSGVLTEFEFESEKRKLLDS